MKIQLTFNDKEIGNIINDMNDEIFAIICNFIEGSKITIEIDTDTGESRIIPVFM